LLNYNRKKKSIIGKLIWLHLRNAAARAA